MLIYAKIAQNSNKTLTRLSILLCLVPTLYGCADKEGYEQSNAKDIAYSPNQAQCMDGSGQRDIEGGAFQMGSDDGYADEGPVRTVSVGDFRIDKTEVSNAQFTEFVKATGYKTLAEKQPDPALHPDIPDALLVAGSAVFISPVTSGKREWWQFIENANWKAPEGPDSSIHDRLHHPVVHIAYEDALAYAKWAGGDLPTEAEWEYAARGGLDKQTYEWGQEPINQGEQKANIWQGSFPIQNDETDGYLGTAPVGCFKANGYGLHDMTGNVWEWTKSSSNENDTNAGLVKGGSYLCATNYCQRYRPAAKQQQERNFSTSHIGFRLVYRDNDSASNSAPSASIGK